MIGAVVGALLASGALASAAAAQDRWDDRAESAGERGGYGLAGPGVDLLLPELRDTRHGQAFVMRNFDFDRDGLISPREARAANRAFLDAHGADRARDEGDRYDRERYDREPVAEPPPAPLMEHGGWDRQGMRDYHFRQGRYGAMLTLQDVLFQTGSAELRPGAEARLRPLADYLRANPRVGLRIDGFTDSVGSAAANVQLSRDRARSVADALAAMGVPAENFQLEGHGESMPVAPNTTAAGRQLNRRVEVTLVGQRATSFD
jgi:outer membrane protein OmpA-like peptidoglycan-associated protein